MDALVKQLVVARDEFNDLSALHDRGLAQKPRITALQLLQHMNVAPLRAALTALRVS